MGSPCPLPGDGSVGALALGVPWAARHRARGGLRLALPLCAAVILVLGWVLRFVTGGVGEMPGGGHGRGKEGLLRVRVLASVLHAASSHF